MLCKWIPKREHDNRGIQVYRTSWSKLEREDELLRLYRSIVLPSSAFLSKVSAIMTSPDDFFILHGRLVSLLEIIWSTDVDLPLNIAY
jgi:hypothetical protein